MKLKITMKDPDTLGDAVQDAVRKEVQALNLTAEEKELVAENRTERYLSLTSKWFEYGEYLTIEIDTELKTATVCERM